jgi:hypothetical protein
MPEAVHVKLSGQWKESMMIRRRSQQFYQQSALAHEATDEINVEGLLSSDKKDCLS